jgi:hypothetical protein
MKPTQLLALATYLTARKIWDLWSNSIDFDTVQKWIKESANPNNYGRGYAGNSLSNGSGAAFVELRRENSGGGVEVTASAYMGPRTSAFASKAWKAKKMDSKLEKMFGNNMRVRIDV